MERNPRRWWILIVLCLSTLVLVIDNDVLLVAVPSLTEDLGASAQQVQWITNAYILVSAGLLLTSGSLSDRYGRRRIMIIGLVVFGASSLVAALADSPGQLIASRAVMGLGSALVLPSTLSILITVFDDEERRKATSVWTSVALGGMIAGPIGGGALITHFGWHSVFLINVPIAILAIVAALILMPESRGPWLKPDPVGSVLSLAGIGALIWAIIDLPVEGITHASTLAKLTVAVVAIAAFVVWELRTPNPMVPLALFRDRAFTGGSFSLVLVQIGAGGLMVAFTQYLQFVLGYSPTKSGLAMLPMLLALLATNGVGATLCQKAGNRAMTVAGLVVVAAGFFGLAAISPGDGYAALVVPLVVLGVGAGLAQPAAVASLMGAVPQEQAGVGSALNDTMQQAGAGLGVAILGSLLTGVFTGRMPASATDEATKSIGDALAVASRTADTGLAAAARDAFTEGLAVTAMAGGVVLLGAATLAFFLLRARTPAAQTHGAPQVEEPVGATG